MFDVEMNAVGVFFSLDEGKNEEENRKIADVLSRL